MQSKVLKNKPKAKRKIALRDNEANKIGRSKFKRERIKLPRQLLLPLPQIVLDERINLFWPI